jgi:hypothetical protein
MYSTGIAYLLWLFSGFGALGFHRFYLGKIPTGLLWMFSGGLCMIGSAYDFFTLRSQVRKANMERMIFGGGAPYGKQKYPGVATVSSSGKKDSVEIAILRLAKKNHGVLTPSDVALSANIPLAQAKKELDAMVSTGYAELRVKKTGGLSYVIPDMLDTGSDFEEF